MQRWRGTHVFDKVRFSDNSVVALGSDQDVKMLWNGSVMQILPLTDDTGALNIGDGTTDMDFKWFGGASTDYVLFDVGNKSLTIAGLVKVDIGASATPLVLTAGSPIFELYSTCASTSGSTSAEPFYVKSTLTGVGGVGGRARFHTYTNVAVGGWVNALKGYMEFGASGSNTGLASSVVGELVLSAGTTTGAYAALEAELVLDTGAKTGQQTSFLYVNATGAAASEFDTYGYLLHVGDGITPAAGKFVSADYQSLRMYFTDGTTTRYIMLSQAENSLSLNVSALTVSTGRIAKLYGTMATPVMDDGYGVVEVDLTVTGIGTGHVAAMSSWVNITTATIPAGSYVCAMNNGIYEASGGTITNAKVIFGMRMHKITSDTDGLCFPFSVNTNNTAITALIDVNNHTDLGLITDAGSDSGTLLPIARDAGGTLKYVKVYDHS